MMRRNWLLRGVKIMLFIAAGVALFSFFVMRLWNWLVPPIFGWHSISFLQALGLLVLSKILFGGFRGGWGHRGRWPRGMRERWEQMSPEQREKFRKGLACGYMRSHAAGEPGTQPDTSPQV